MEVGDCFRGIEHGVGVVPTNGHDDQLGLRDVENYRELRARETRISASRRERVGTRTLRMQRKSAVILTVSDPARPGCHDREDDSGQRARYTGHQQQ